MKTGPWPCTFQSPTLQHYKSIAIVHFCSWAVRICTNEEVPFHLEYKMVRIWNIFLTYLCTTWHQWKNRWQAPRNMRFHQSLLCYLPDRKKRRNCPDFQKMFLFQFVKTTYLKILEVLKFFFNGPNRIFWKIYICSISQILWVDNFRLIHPQNLNRRICVRMILQILDLIGSANLRTNLYHIDEFLGTSDKLAWYSSVSPAGLVHRAV